MYRARYPTYLTSSHVFDNTEGNRKWIHNTYGNSRFYFKLETPSSETWILMPLSCRRQQSGIMTLISLISFFCHWYRLLSRLDNAAIEGLFCFCSNGTWWIRNLSPSQRHPRNSPLLRGFTWRRHVRVFLSRYFNSFCIGAMNNILINFDPDNGTTTVYNKHVIIMAISVLSLSAAGCIKKWLKLTIVSGNVVQ
jgi:hypothetical protein